MKSNKSLCMKISIYSLFSVQHPEQWNYPQISNPADQNRNRRRRRKRDTFLDEIFVDIPGDIYRTFAPPPPPPEVFYEELLPVEGYDYYDEPDINHFADDDVEPMSVDEILEELGSYADQFKTYETPTPRDSSVNMLTEGDKVHFDMKSDVVTLEPIVLPPDEHIDDSDEDDYQVDDYKYNDPDPLDVTVHLPVDDFVVTDPEVLEPIYLPPDEDQEYQSESDMPSDDTDDYDAPEVLEPIHLPPDDQESDDTYNDYSHPVDLESIYQLEPMMPPKPFKDDDYRMNLPSNHLNRPDANDEESYLDAVKNYVDPIAPYVKDFVDPIGPAVQDFVDTNAPNIKYFLNENIPQVQKMIDRNVPMMQNFINDNSPRVQDFIDENVPTMQNYIEHGIDQGSSAVRNIIDQSGPVVDHYIAPIGTSVQNFIDRNRHHVDDLLRLNRPVVNNFIEMNQPVVEKFIEKNKPTVQNFIDRNQQHAQKLIEPIVTPLRPVVNDLVETEPVQSFMQQALTTMKNALAAKENYYDNNLRSGRNFEGDSFANIMMYNNGDDDIDIPAPHTAYPKHAAPHLEYPPVQHTPTNYADSEPGEDPEDNPGMQMSAGEDPILYAKAMQPQIQRPLQLSNPYTPQPAYKPQRPLPGNDRSLNNGQPVNNGMPTYNRIPVNNRKPVNNRQPANSGVPVNNRIPATSTVSGNNRQYQPLNNQQGTTQYKAGPHSNRNVNSAG